MVEATRPLGVLGGTFDPVHYGHLRLAEEMADACGLVRVLLIPAAQPNLRATPSTSAYHRLAMLRLAARDNPRLAVDGRELEREGISYTVDTLQELRAEFGAARPVCLILGADAFLRLTQWSRWRQLFGLCHLLVAARLGYDLDADVAEVPALDAQWRARAAEAAALSGRPAGAIVRVDIPRLEISATQVRARLSRRAGVRYLLPDAVIEYIATHRLYEVQ